MESQERDLYETMNKKMVSWKNNFWVVIQQKCSSNKNLKTPFIIHKQAQKLNKKRTKCR
jgi:hypothetical protein